MTAQARRGSAAGLCLLVAGLLVLLAVRHAQARYYFGGFGLQLRDIVVFAVLVALLAGAAGLLDRAWRSGLPAVAVPLLGGAAGLLVVVLLVMGDPYQVGFSNSRGAYSSELFLDFSAELLWGPAVVVVAALGLLPVAAVAAALGLGSRMNLGRARVAALVLCVVAAVLLLAVLERSVALLDVLRGDAQQLTEIEAVTWVAALWALCGVGWSALGLLRGTALVVALLVPLGAAVGAAVLLATSERHTCCYSYAPPDGAYVPPPVGPDLLLLAGSLAAGVGLPLALRRIQLRRVSTSASTPPG